VAACSAAMCHMIDVYRDDRPFCVIYLLRVCVVSNDRHFQSVCAPQSAADHGDLASLIPSHLYSIGMGHRSPNDKLDYRRDSSLLTNNSIAHIIHFGPPR